VNLELRPLRSDYTTVRQVLCFWEPQLDKMATWSLELRQMHQGIARRFEQLGECPREIVRIHGILQHLFDGMKRRTVKQKNMQEKTAKMEVWDQKVNHQMSELQTEVARAQEETKEQFEEVERKCYGKLTEHHKWLTDLERRIESTMQEIKARKLNMGRLEENLDGTEQNMQDQSQSGMAGFVQHFLPSIHARIKRLESDTPSSQR